MKREHKPWTETFVPHERWVLPAKRSHADDEEPDADDAAKRRPVQDTARAGSADSAEGRGRVIVQAGLGLCVSFVIAACGSARDNRPAHVGPPLGDTHISQAPSDPTVPPPDAADYEQPSPGLPISAPGTGPVPSSTAPQPQAPSDQAQPGAFSPPPPSENQPGAAQPQIPQPTPPSTTPLPQQ